MPKKRYCVYILTSKMNDALYIGVTSDLAKKVHQTRNERVAGFTQNTEYTT